MLNGVNGLCKTKGHLQVVDMYKTVQAEASHIPDRPPLLALLLCLHKADISLNETNSHELASYTVDLREQGLIISYHVLYAFVPIDSSPFRNNIMGIAVRNFGFITFYLCYLRLLAEGIWCQLNQHQQALARKS